MGGETGEGKGPQTRVLVILCKGILIGKQLKPEYEGGMGPSLL